MTCLGRCAPVHEPPAPLTLLIPYVSAVGCRDTSPKREYPVAEAHGSQGLYLPSYFALEEHDVETICGCIKHFFGSVEREGMSIRQLSSSASRYMSGEANGTGAPPTNTEICPTNLHELSDLCRLAAAAPLGDILKVVMKVEEYLERSAPRGEAGALIDDIRKVVCAFRERRVDVDPRSVTAVLDLLEAAKGVAKKLGDAEFRHSDCCWEPPQYDPSSLLAGTQCPLQDELVHMLDWLFCHRRPTVSLVIGSENVNDAVNRTWGSSPWQVCIKALTWDQLMTPNANIDAPYTPELAQTVGQASRPGNAMVELAFLDFSHCRSNEVQAAWSAVKPSLKPNCVVIMNGVSRKYALLSIIAGTEKLQPLHKPLAGCVAFAYDCVDRVQVSLGGETTRPQPAPVLLKFAKNPGWGHHHNGGFSGVIDEFRRIHHDENGTLAFIPAVETALAQASEHPELNGLWCGIVHEIPVHPKRVHYPDLHRLCTDPKYRGYLCRCRILFTLTRLQAMYLREHLPWWLSIPVVPLTYPSRAFDSAHAAQTGDADGCRPPSCNELRVVLIGGFGRDFPAFFRMRFANTVAKVLLAGTEETQRAGESAPEDVTILRRMEPQEYEQLLASSVPCLTVLPNHDGFASTLVVECICRSIPILLPKLDGFVEYLGPDYPLFYPAGEEDLVDLVTCDSIQRARDYLKGHVESHKTRFSVPYFIDAITNAVAQLSPVPDVGGAREVQHKPSPQRLTDKDRLDNAFDVTVMVCCWKRTHHLAAQLQAIFEKRDNHKVEVIVWNNNESRECEVRGICEPFIRSSTNDFSVQVLSSSRNVFCAHRFMIPPIMRSPELLIIDDDVIPVGGVVSFFLGARAQHPEAVLCLRGHSFSRFDVLNTQPELVWGCGNGFTRFHDDGDPETALHFVHADCCLISRHALQLASSVHVPDPRFMLVDDYWLSFVLQHKFNIGIRKLCACSGDGQALVLRTEDSDLAGLALHKDPDVLAARYSLCAHHMAHHWPWEPVTGGMWAADSRSTEEIARVKNAAFRRGAPASVGINIPANITEDECKDLAAYGITLVRIGAVDLGDEEREVNVDAFIDSLDACLGLLRNANINAIITLHDDAATGPHWVRIAKTGARAGNCVAYDLVNEPYLGELDNTHASHARDASATSNYREQTRALLQRFTSLARAIRGVDEATRLMISPPHWSSSVALPSMLNELGTAEFTWLKQQSILSVHVYDPHVLTTWRRHEGKYTFPGDVPIYPKAQHTEVEAWDEERLRCLVRTIATHATKAGIHVCVTEIGIDRRVEGALLYLQAATAECLAQGVSCLLYSFRARTWDGMDLEIGNQAASRSRHPTSSADNLLAQVLRSAHAIGNQDGWCVVLPAYPLPR